jgi:hypothetical protein
MDTKALIIRQIYILKPIAEFYGFDFPTNSFEEGTEEELVEFLSEIAEWVGFERGYEAAQHNKKR